MSFETPVVSVRGVSKRYAIYERPVDRLKQAVWRGRRQFSKEFWALHDVSFEIHKGQSVGIVGCNGSGKSTLLHIIAGTLSPSEGEVSVRGRLAPLLELGSGFDPDFTGRENVMLNATLLGLSAEEVSDRLEDILSFADIGEYIDQPVRTYSSGMFARLAFSVAAHVDPEILIVDEILSVGDMEFQHKCISLIRNLIDRGMTLLYVAHSPDSVRSTCDTGVFLDKGKLLYWGAAERAVDLYLSHVRRLMNEEALGGRGMAVSTIPVQTQIPGTIRYGTGQVQLESVSVTDADGRECRAFRFGDDILINATFRSYGEFESLSVSFLVRDATGIDLFGTTTFDENVTLPPIHRGQRAEVRFRFKNALRSGNFAVSLAVHQLSRWDYSDNLLFDQVDGCATFATTPDPNRPVHYKLHVPTEVDVRLGG